MKQPDILPSHVLEHVRDLALRQVKLMDDLEDAVCAEDMPRVLQIARQLVGLERELKDG